MDKIPTHKKDLVDEIEGVLNDFENNEMDKEEALKTLAFLFLKQLPQWHDFSKEKSNG